ncbi:unnamed protein product [Brassica rapa subsp. narinosa]
MNHLLFFFQANGSERRGLPPSCFSPPCSFLFGCALHHHHHRTLVNTTTGHESGGGTGD